MAHGNTQRPAQVQVKRIMPGLRSKIRQEGVVRPGQHGSAQLASAGEAVHPGHGVPEGVLVLGQSGHAGVKIFRPFGVHEHRRGFDGQHSKTGACGSASCVAQARWRLRHTLSRTAPTTRICARDAWSDCRVCSMLLENRRLGWTFWSLSLAQALRSFLHQCG